MENPIKMDYLGVPLFLETPIYTYIVCMLHYTHELYGKKYTSTHK